MKSVTLGWPCEECGSEIKYNEEFDAHYCPTCNVWKELTCSDPNCGFCTDRPENPRSE